MKNQVILLISPDFFTNQEILPYVIGQAF